MSVVEPGSSSSNLIERVKNILMKPKETWDVIETEPATVGSIYRGYVIPLAAVPAICSFIGLSVIGTGFMGIGFKVPLVGGLVQGVVSYVLTLVGVFVTALVVDGLAPSFGATKNQIQALKLSAYSSTAVWVAGAFTILPPLAALVIIGGLYSLYLMYLGLPKLMKSPEDKTTTYFVVIIVVTIVVYLVIGAITTPLRLIGGGLAGPLAHSGAQGALSLPGGASIDLGKAEEASRRMERMAEGLQSGTVDGKTVQPTNPDVLKAFLPDNIAGFNRTEVSATSGGVGGINGSNAEGAYKKGEASFRLTITDMGAMGAMAGMAGALNVQSSTESDGRYEKVGKINGRMTTESFDRNTGRGSYGMMVGDRFMVQAEGDGVTIGDLKEAVGSVNPQRLEQMAKAG